MPGEEEQQRRPPTSGYSWSIIGDYIRCYSGGNTQFITQDFLVEATELSPFHDEELAGATREINEIFARIEQGNRAGERELAVLLTPLGHFLAWTQTMPEDAGKAPREAVTADSGEAEVMEALKLRGRERGPFPNS
jgi:hypothetical protein